MCNNKTFNDVSIQSQLKRKYPNGNLQKNAIVDILMATYNGERYISDQIKSIQKQSFTNWRLLISDDCSSDDTPKIIHKFAAEDSRIIVVSDGMRYGSAKNNFLSLTNKAEAPYVMFSDQDDVWLPTKIEKTLAKMREMEKKTSGNIPLLVFTDMKVVREDLSIVSESFERFSNINPRRTRFSHLLAQSIGAGCTMMVNQIAIKYISKIKNPSNIIMHDWWLSLVAAAFGNIDYIDESTSLYRQHGNNEVGAKRYSPLAASNKIDLMQKSVADTLIQAAEFYQTYTLSTEQMKIIDNYLKAFARKSIIALMASGCWKKGLRKIGQIIILYKGLQVKDIDSICFESLVSTR